jgi:hypothetical protein
MEQTIDIMKLLEKLKEDPSWCEDKDQREAFVRSFTYFLIEF